MKDTFFFSWFETQINFKDPKLVYLRSLEMKLLQTYTISSFYVGGLRGMLVYNNSLSPVQRNSIRLCTPGVCF